MFWVKKLIPLFLQCLTMTTSVILNMVKSQSHDIDVYEIEALVVLIIAIVWK